MLTLKTLYLTQCYSQFAHEHHIALPAPIEFELNSDQAYISSKRRDMTTSTLFNNIANRRVVTNGIMLNIAEQKPQRQNRWSSYCMDFPNHGTPGDISFSRWPMRAIM